MTGPRLLGLAHIGFAVPSIDEFRRTWGTALGISDWLVRDVPQPDGAVQLAGKVQPAAFSRVAFARLADTAIELVEPIRGRTRTSAWLAEHGPGIHHLAFWVADLPAAVRALGEDVEVSYSPLALRPELAALTTAPVQPRPDFWAYTERVGATVPWCLELLDARAAPPVRATFGDYMRYPPAAESCPETSGTNPAAPGQGAS